MINKDIEFSSWSIEEAKEIHTKLEVPNWAPWLAYSPRAIAHMSTLFPDGQIAVFDHQGRPRAYLSTNRIEWDGDLNTLPTWDQVAGGEAAKADYSKLYQHRGNTIVMMSMSVDGEDQGKGYATMLTEAMKLRAQSLNVEHLIGPFRPSQYGEYKLDHSYIGFEEYCYLKREDGLPRDAWLRSMVRNGMIPLKVENAAMQVVVKLSRFNEFRKTYHPEKWQEVEKSIWECGEVGRWYLEDGCAKYIESNLWGEVPLNNEHP